MYGRCRTARRKVTKAESTWDLLGQSVASSSDINSRLFWNNACSPLQEGLGRFSILANMFEVGLELANGPVLFIKGIANR